MPFLKHAYTRIDNLSCTSPMPVAAMLVHGRVPLGDLDTNVVLPVLVIDRSHAFLRDTYPTLSRPPFPALQSLSFQPC